MKYTCPISKNTIDENVVRLVAFFSLILVILGFFFSKWIFLFLAFDYLARIYFPKFSILKHISILIMHVILNINPKPIGAAPKRFAAGIGFFFSITIFMFLNGNIYCTQNCPSVDLFLDTLKNIFVVIFIIAISLATFFSYCLGCKIYSWLQFVKNKFKK